MSKLLINEEPMQVLPALATAIGLNEAIVIQQIHYWLNKSKIVINNQKWVYNTFEDWHKQFPFWSIRTLKSVFQNLIKMDLLNAKQLSKDKFDKTNYYTINYQKLQNIESQILKNNIEQNTEKEPKQSNITDSAKVAQSTNTNEPIDSAKVAQSRECKSYTLDSAKVAQSYIVKSFDRDYYTETTTEILSPKSSLKPKKEKERSFDKSLFLKFIEDTRKIYKGDGNRNWFPTLFDYQDNQIGVDSSGHLYVKGTGETLQPSEAQNLWEYIFKHKEQIVSIEHQIENHRQKIIQELQSKTLSQGEAS